MDISTVGEALQRASFYLRRAKVDHPRLEAELLLSWITGQSRLQLLLDRQQRLPEEMASGFMEAVGRRCQGEPLAYITGEKEFYGLSFHVNRDVLVPRPETEFVVEAALAWARERGLASGEGINLIDLGTGSGNLVITLACALPAARAWAVDISKKALTVAIQNAKRHGVAERITWCCGSYFQALHNLSSCPSFNLVVGNPPYVQSHAMASLPVTVKNFEPALALDGGEDGLAGYRAILRDLPRHIQSPGLLALEIGAGQYEPLQEICREINLFQEITYQRDYQGWPRVLIGLF